MHLILEPGPLPHQVSASGHLPTQRPRSVVRQPHRRQKVRREQLRQDPGIDLVGLDLRLRDRPGLRRIRHHHPTHDRGQQGGDRVTVAGGLQRHLIITTQVRCPVPQRLRCHRDPALVADQSVFDHRQLRELAVHVHADIAHHPDSLHHLDVGNRWDGTTPTDTRSQRSRTSRRGGQLLTRAHSPLSKNGLPKRVPRGPLFRTVTPYARLKTPGQQNTTRTLAVFHTGY
jgi:hypothetical protein